MKRSLLFVVLFSLVSTLLNGQRDSIEFRIVSDTSINASQERPFHSHQRFFKLMTEQHPDSNFEATLDSILAKSNIHKEIKNERPYYTLHLKMGNYDFEFYHMDLSKMYMADTILIDTFMSYDHYISGRYTGDQIMLRRDTIYNQIKDLNEMSAYREGFKNYLIRSAKTKQ